MKKALKQPRLRKGAVISARVQMERTGWAVTADPRSFVTHTAVVSLETNSNHTTGRGHTFVCFVRPTNPHAVPLHSNMLMYLCSALIGPSDAHPAPPVFAGSLQSVLQSGPRHCVRACSANIMQTNTSLLFGTSCTDPPLWKKGRSK